MMDMALSVQVESLPSWVRFAFLLSTLDVLLGTIVSIAQKRLSSQLGYEGIMRRLAFILLLCFVWLVLHWVKQNEFALLYSGAVSLVVIAYELSSIKRHLLKLGVPKRYLVLIPDDRVLGGENETHTTNTRD